MTPLFSSVVLTSLPHYIVESAFLPMDFSFTVQVLTWWVSFYFVCLGGYLIFISEHKLPLIGFVMGLLGISVYFVIQFPEFLPDWITLNWLLQTALALLAIFMIYVTILMWYYYELDLPWTRIRSLLLNRWR